MSQSGYCKVSISPLRADASDRSEMISQLLFGEIVTVEEIKSPWCKVRSFMDNYEGYVDLKHIQFLSEKEVNRWMDGLDLLFDLQNELETPWGTQRIFRGAYIPFGDEKSFRIGNDHFKLLNDKKTKPKSDSFELAQSYLNTPYLWGGKTPFGIDCSGLTQLVFRFSDINLPRDASQQIEYGQTIDYEDLQTGDVAFFHNRDGKIIHVGICHENGSIIHASGWVRIDQLTSEGITNVDSGLQTHQLNSIKRM